MILYYKYLRPTPNKTDLTTHVLGLLRISSVKIQVLIRYPCIAPRFCTLRGSEEKPDHRRLIQPDHPGPFFTAGRLLTLEYLLNSFSCKKTLLPWRTNSETFIIHQQHQNCTRLAGPWICPPSQNIFYSRH
jgi:hypothetical protein